MTQLVIPRNSLVQQRTRIDPRCKDIVSAITFDGSLLDLVSGQRVALGAAGALRPNNMGIGLRSAGGAAAGGIPLDLSGQLAITISFWLLWDAYANDDKLLMELTSNTGTNAGGFMIDPNSSTGGFEVFWNGGASNRLKSGYFARPSAGVWHRYSISIDRLAPLGQTGITAWVDGALVPITPGLTQSPNGLTFANSTLFLFSRNNTSLFGAGQLQDLVIRNRVLSDAEARADFEVPQQIYRADPIRIYSFPTGAISINSITASNITQTGARITLGLTR